MAFRALDVHVRGYGRRQMTSRAGSGLDLDGRNRTDIEMGSDDRTINVEVHGIRDTRSRRRSIDDIHRVRQCWLGFDEATQMKMENSEKDVSSINLILGT